MLNKIGENIRNIRLKQKLTLQNVADMAMMSISGLSHIENGKRSPTCTTLIYIADALECKPSDFFKGFPW